MNKKVAIIVSPNWRDYGKKYLADCLASLREQDWTGESKIFLIDNESTEESFKFLKESVEREEGEERVEGGEGVKRVKEEEGGKEGEEGVEKQKGVEGDERKEKNEGTEEGRRRKGNFEIIREEKNEGFAKANNDAMKKAIEQGYDYLILFNMDTEVAPQVVSELVEAAEGQHTPAFGHPSQEGNIGSVQARLMLHPEKDKVNSLGNATHFLGFGYTVGYKQEMSKVESRKLKVEEIFYPSGAAVLFKAEALKHVGLFNEEYWMYNEDQEIGWRLWLAGYQVVLAPEAVVYHKYEFSRSATRYYWMDRNRIISILLCYHWATLLLILPAFIIMELGLMVFAIKGGWFKEKLRVYGYFLKFGNWQKIYHSRQAVQKLRKIKDSALIGRITGIIGFQEYDNVLMRLGNIFFNAYWSIVKLLIFW